MDIRPLTESYAVSPQIEPTDLPAIKAAGYTTVIDNRPDGEVPGHLHAAAMRAAAEAIGLTFVANPVVGGALTKANVTAQGQAIAAASGPVLAYCASGNRSSIVWALSQAGKHPTDVLIGLPERHGYQLQHLRQDIEALARDGA
ncbi:MAG: TIGR01244 family phosphatase [Tabrizicola sp.]|nr:TIGR01244 family phosphatase [Tabrizicola sp.]